MKLWFLFQEHQNTDVGLYGVDISVQAENLTIEIKEGSNKGLSLMKVLSKGNFFSDDITFWKFKKTQKDWDYDWTNDQVHFAI